MTTMRWGSAVLGVVVAWLATAALAPGCGSPPAPTGGQEPLGSVMLEWNDLGGTHSYGSTSCPQTAGSILLTNDGATPADVNVTESSTQLDLYVIPATGGAGTPFTGPVTLQPGQTLELQVRFNCSATADVHTNITVSATPTGGTAETFDIPFDLDIQGAP